MFTPNTLAPNPNATVLPSGEAITTRPPGTSPVPWPTDIPKPLPGDHPLDDTLTEAAGLARNTDALGPYAGSF